MSELNFNKINIKGACFQSETALEIFPSLDKKHEITLIYGKNGCGKTTISNAFVCYSCSKKECADCNLKKIEQFRLIDKDDKELICNEFEKRKIFVYNENFIDQNVKLVNSETLSSIVMLGEQIEIDNKLKKLDEEITANEKKRKELENQKEEFQDFKSIKSPQYYKKRIEDILREKGAWAEIGQTIRSGKHLTSVNDTAIERIGCLNVKESKGDIQNEFLNKMNILETAGNINFSQTNELVEVEDGVLLKAVEILKREILKPTLTDREKKLFELLQIRGVSFYEDVKNTFFDKDRELCPYCLKTIEKDQIAELMISIEKVLNDDVEKHLEELSKINITTLKKDIPDVYKEIDNKLFEQAKDINMEIEKNIEQLNSLIDRKKDNVYCAIEYDSSYLKIQIEQLNKIIRDIQLKRKILLEESKKIDDLKKELNELNDKLAYFNIKALYDLYKKQAIEEQNNKLEIENIVKSIDNKQKEISELKAQKNNIYIALEEINKSLRYIFFSKNRIRLNIKENNYFIKIKDKDVSLKRVSVGERNAIALSYFFTKVLENKNENEKYKDDIVLVIDDPITSFDFENKVGILSFLREKFMQIIENSNSCKIIILTHNMQTYFDLQTIFKDITEHTKQEIKNTIKRNELKLSTNTLSKFDENKDRTYRKFINNIFEYANGNEDFDAEIGNIMRKALEAYSTFNYGIGMKDLFRDISILNKIKNDSERELFSNFMYRLVLNNESHTEDATKSYPDIDVYLMMDKEEKVNTAKLLLIFFMKIDIIHLQKMLYDSSKIDIIRTWEKEILS